MCLPSSTALGERVQSVELTVTDLCRYCALEALFLIDCKKIGKRCKLDNIALFVGEFWNRYTLGKLEIC